MKKVVFIIVIFIVGILFSSRIPLQEKIVGDSSDGYLGQTLAGGRDTIVARVTQKSSQTESGSAVYIYTHNQDVGHYELVQKISPSESEGYDESFGHALAFDNDTLVVNSYGNGMTYIYERNQGGLEKWGEVTRFNNIQSDYYTLSTISISGDILAVGSYKERAVYIFDRNEGGDGAWGIEKRITAPLLCEESQFGLGVALSGDTLVVGDRRYADNAGSAYVFERNKGGVNNWGVSRTLEGPSAPGIYFGYTVAVDKNEIAVGLSGEQAYVFNRNEGGAEQWGRVAIVECSTGSDSLGTEPDLALENGRLLLAVREKACLFERHQGGKNNWGSYTGWIGPYRSSYGSEVTFAGEVIVISDAAESTLYLFAEESDDESADADEDFTESDDEFVDVDEDFVDSDSESIDESTELPSGETKDSGCGCLLLPDNL